MVYDVSQQQLQKLDTKWRTDCPHVVILGAGASLAAFPNGDGRGKRLPLMANVVDVLGIGSLIESVGHDPRLNFETLYSTLHAADAQSPILKEIENAVAAYFSSLELPRHLTLYDLLLLSLREKDAIFTFNWDSFLADAYARHSGEVPLPHVFHLHGNVRVSFCGHCRMSMPNAESCPDCDVPLIPTPLLYPVEKKNYANDPFLSLQWEAARRFISNAAIITIFGYSAPTTDQEAMSIFTDAWKGDDAEKLIEWVEIIDIRDPNELGRQWSSFAFFNHYDIRRSFFGSLLARYPRRNCEALGHMGFDGQFVESVPWAGNLEGLRQSVEQLVAAEN